MKGFMKAVLTSLGSAAVISSCKYIYVVIRDKRKQKKENVEGLEKTKLIVIIKTTFSFLVVAFLVGYYQIQLADFVISKVQNRDLSQYGFEGDVRAWSVQNPLDCGLAISSPGIVKYTGIKGDHALQLNVQLDGSANGRTEHKDKGEVWVDPRVISPKDCQAPCVLDLSGKTITAIVDLPSGPIGKEADKPIHLKLFVERCVQGQIMRTESEPFNITAQGLIPLKLRLESGSDICKIGIKISLAGDDQNTYDQNYSIYIDAVDW